MDELFVFHCNVLGLLLTGCIVLNKCLGNYGFLLYIGLHCGSLKGALQYAGVSAS